MCGRNPPACANTAGRLYCSLAVLRPRCRTPEAALPEALQWELLLLERARAAGSTPVLVFNLKVQAMPLLHPAAPLRPSLPCPPPPQPIPDVCLTRRRTQPTLRCRPQYSACRACSTRAACCSAPKCGWRRQRPVTRWPTFFRRGRGRAGCRPAAWGQRRSAPLRRQTDRVVPRTPLTGGGGSGTHAGRGEVHSRAMPDRWATLLASRLCCTAAGGSCGPGPPGNFFFFPTPAPPLRRPCSGRGGVSEHPDGRRDPLHAPAAPPGARGARGAPAP